MVEYLERKAVLDVMLRAQTTYGAYMAIAHMEPAKVVKQREGRWNENPIAHKTGLRWVCSECGNGSVFPSQYCDNCGAAMTYLKREGSGDCDG